MLAAELLEQLQTRGVSISLDQDQIVLRPASKIPAHLLYEVRQIKSELIDLLSGDENAGSRYQRKYHDVPLGDRELQEIVQQVKEEGLVLLWSEAVQDFISFYNTDKDRENIPPGFVPYSLKELSQLFAEGQEAPSDGVLRMVHEAKKLGGLIISDSNE